MTFLTLNMAIELRNEIRRTQPSKSDPISSVVRIMGYEGDRIVWREMTVEVEAAIRDNVYELSPGVLDLLRKQARVVSNETESQKALFRAFLKAVFEHQDQRHK